LAIILERKSDQRTREDEPIVSMKVIQVGEDPGDIAVMGKLSHCLESRHPTFSALMLNIPKRMQWRRWGRGRGR